MSTKLNPCTFCGKQEVSYGGTPPSDWIYIECNYCGARSPAKRDIKELVTIWNNAKPRKAQDDN